MKNELCSISSCCNDDHRIIILVHCIPDISTSHPMTDQYKLARSCRMMDCIKYDLNGAWKNKTKWAIRATASVSVFNDALINDVAAAGSADLVDIALSMAIAKKNKYAHCELAFAENAALRGYLDILKLLKSRGLIMHSSMYLCAAKSGHMEVLLWLRENECPWSDLTCAVAAKYGHMDILEWARANGSWDEWTCSYAAKGGQIDILKWLRAQNPPCPWNELTCAYAAENGHLEVLKWMRAQDPPCEWDEGTCCYAAIGRHTDVLKWARDNGCP